jgi:hypothetical protein
MQAFISPLSAFSSNASVNIDLGFVRPFLAWITVTMVDSLNNYDRDNVVAADIFTVDGVRTPTRAVGGDHFGASGAIENLFAGAVTGRGRNILFFLRVRPPLLLSSGTDIAAHGEAIVLTLD